MLDKLVVSKNSTKENRRIGNFLVTSFLAITSILSVGLIYSLFSYNLAMGTSDLSISTLVAPVLETEAKPEIIKKEESQPEKSVEKNQQLIVRKTNTRRIDETPSDVPDKVSVTASKVRSRPAGFFTTGKVDSGEITASNSANRENRTDSPSIGISGGVGKPATPEVIKVEKPKIEEPPALKKAPEPIEKKPTTPISGGVVNGKALNLVQPIYSAVAKTMNVSGKVTVQVLIDEDGNVVSANAIDGNPLLRQSAVIAARKSKFSPTYLSKQKVKVSGVIIYNFIK